MPKHSGIILLAVGSFVISLLTLGLVYVRYQDDRAQDHSSTIDVIPAEKIDRVRRRGPGGRLHARLLEIGNKKSFDAGEVAFLLKALGDPVTLANSWDEMGIVGKVSMSGDDVLSTRRLALAAMSERLLNAEMDDGMRKSLEDAIISSLEDSEPRVRLTAVSSVLESGLASRPDVRNQLRAMLSDPDPKVANCAARGLGE